MTVAQCLILIALAAFFCSSLAYRIAYRRGFDAGWLAVVKLAQKWLTPNPVTNFQILKHWEEG